MLQIENSKNCFLFSLIILKLSKQSTVKLALFAVIMQYLPLTITWTNNLQADTQTRRFDRRISGQQRLNFIDPKKWSHNRAVNLKYKYHFYHAFLYNFKHLTPKNCTSDRIFSLEYETSCCIITNIHWKEKKLCRSKTSTYISSDFP